MKKGLFLLSMVLFFACNSTTSTDSNSSEAKKNEVLVLGAIHDGHLTSKRYGIDVLKNLIKSIQPDYVLAEIPPDRFPAAKKEFLEKDTITEARVRRFPEYVNVLFPLTKELDFEIIPTAGWTKPMSDARSKKLREISKDAKRAADWKAYQVAEAATDSLIANGGGDDNPYWIHTDQYDDAVEVWARTYNRLFNDELGPGGWDNINTAHFSNIAKALDAHIGEGKRFLIIYGSWHKGWFLRHLRKRDDINLLNMKPFLDTVFEKKGS